MRKQRVIQEHSCSYMTIARQSEKGGNIMRKQEVVRNKMGQKKIRKAIGVSAVAMMLAFSTVAVSTSQTTYAMTKTVKTTKESETYKVVTVDLYQDKDGTMSASLKIPKVEGKTKAIQAFNKEIKRYMLGIKNEYLNAKKEVKDTKNGYLDIMTTYEPMCNNNDYLSIQIRTTSGYGSGSEKSKAFTLDKSTGKIVTLKDLFKKGADYQDVISKNIISQMKAQMKEDKDRVYFVEGSGLENMGAFTKIEKNQNFYIDKNGKLVIVFDEYEVAPGSMGICTFTIGKTALKSIVPTNSKLK